MDELTAPHQLRCRHVFHSLYQSSAAALRGGSLPPENHHFSEKQRHKKRKVIISKQPELIHFQDKNVFTVLMAAMNHKRSCQWRGRRPNDSSGRMGLHVKENAVDPDWDISDT